MKNSGIPAVFCPSTEIKCEESSGWKFVTSVTETEPGVSVTTISATCNRESLPPAFKAVIKFPQLDIAHAWNPNFGCAENISPLPWWGNVFNIARTQLIKCFFTDEDLNRVTIAASETKRELKLGGGLKEEDFCYYISIDYFTGTKEPMKEYVTEIRLDTRAVNFADAIRGSAAWQSNMSGTPTVPPPAAYQPLYSTWYNFHKDVTDKAVEAECTEAAKLGMKVVILDDGWQCDNIERSYASTGDWFISTRRFPDMHAHVARIHALGMKYMVWFAVPFIGTGSTAYPQFKDKMLRYSEHLKCWIMDPRFPEIRDYLKNVYLRCLKEWDIDGFKLDFIDSFEMEGLEDPALKQNFAGRDCRSIQDGVEKLLEDVTTSLSAVKKDLLFEFRQSYIGPVIRKYGNMIRVGDCPGSALRNRVHIANLRLLCDGSSVHSDMLRWNEDETPENAAKFIFGSIFGTVQYSAMLSRASDPMKKMLRHWIDFNEKHCDTLLKSKFHPYYPALNYPIVEAESDTERIIVIYNSAISFDIGKITKPTYVINAASHHLKGLCLPGGVNVIAFDTYGTPTEGVLPPPSGYIRITEQQ